MPRKKPKPESHFNVSGYDSRAANPTQGILTFLRHQETATLEQLINIPGVRAGGGYALIDSLERQGAITRTQRLPRRYVRRG